MLPRAIAITSGYFDSVFAKTAHGLVRGPCRFELAGVVDARFAGQDAGFVLDGKSRGIPFFDSTAAALDWLSPAPTHCIVGVATMGGVLPAALYDELTFAAGTGMTLVNGLHYLLTEDENIAARVRESGGAVLDLRKPKPGNQLRFWTGEVLSIPAPRVAVLGMDCAIGKRTTCLMLREALRARGCRAQMIYTGQTGWLQGLQHGFIFDATLNDFVSGELEGAILACYRDTKPDVILMEGQSSLRNPAGPAGSEFILSGGAAGVILQHAPDREYFEEFEDLGLRIPHIQQEIELIGLLGAEVWAVTLFSRGMTPERACRARDRLSGSLGLPVAIPLAEGVDTVAEVVAARLAWR